MAKNYTYGWRLKELGYTEVPESEYTERQKEDKEFIDMLSNVVWKAGCGGAGAGGGCGLVRRAAVLCGQAGDRYRLS